MSRPMFEVSVRLQATTAVDPNGSPPLFVVDQLGCLYRSDISRLDEFESQVGQDLARRNIQRWCFGTRAVLVEDDETISMRQASLPLRAGETEVLWLLDVDLDDGVDVGRVTVHRTAQGVRFGPLTVLAEDCQILDETPGFGIVRAVLETGVQA